MKRINGWQRMRSLLCVLALMVGMLPVQMLHVHATEEETLPPQSAQSLSPETLEGKTISILGASISTFAGTSNGTPRTLPIPPFVTMRNTIPTLW